MLKQFDITQAPVAPSLHWLEAYGTWLRFDYIKRGGGELCEKSMAAYLQDARHLARWFVGYTQSPFSIEQVTAAHVRAYFIWQEGHKDKVNTRNRRLANLRTMVKWGISSGALDKDPSLRQARACQQMLPRKAKNKDEIVALEAVATVGSHLKRHTAKYAVLGARDAVVWSLFKNTALRIEMICNLDLADVQLDQGKFRVMGKGNVEQEFPINDELKASIEGWLAIRPHGGPALVTDWHGQRVTTGQVRRRLYQIGATAGVKVRPHDMRHTKVENFMRTALSSGMPVEKALSATQTLAGHADPRTTMGYLRATFDELAMVNAAAGIV